MKPKNNYMNIFNYFKETDSDIIEFNKLLGAGAFGEVREVKMGAKTFAAKLVRKEKSDNIEADHLRGSNIIKIVKMAEKEFEGQSYDLIIMEKAVLRDLGTLIRFLIGRNLLKLNNTPFAYIIGDNILRYFSRQIISGLEVLERSELVHFDIKPENILIISGFILKISDFSFLRNLNSLKKGIKIPGGTSGYVSPEYYLKKEINSDVAKKQDYFALGATIYYLKFGKRLLNYKRDPNNNFINELNVIDLLQKEINLIKANKLLDKDFVDFLWGLLHYLPEERFSFDKIYRNTWVNENRKEITDIINSFLEGEEDKLMRELIKSDYILEKKAQIKSSARPKFKFVL